MRQLRGLLPELAEVDREQLEGLSPDQLSDELVKLAYLNEEEGTNLLQLLQAMGRFLPLLPAVPNLTSLATQRSIPCSGRCSRNAIARAGRPRSAAGRPARDSGIRGDQWRRRP